MYKEAHASTPTPFTRAKVKYIYIVQEVGYSVLLPASEKREDSRQLVVLHLERFHTSFVRSFLKTKEKKT
jgi:hypothetical protein